MSFEVSLSPDVLALPEGDATAVDGLATFVNRLEIVAASGDAEQLAAFFENWRDDQPSKRTRDGYTKDVDAFARDLEVPRLVAVAALFKASPIEAKAVLTKWHAIMRDKGLSAAAINRRFSGIKSLVKFGRDCGLTVLVPSIRRARGEKVRDMRGPSAEACRAVFASLRGSKTEIRDRALMHCVLTLGLRAHEVCTLDLADIVKSGEGYALRPLRKGKDRKSFETEVVINGAALNAIRALADLRKAEGGIASDPLFISARHKKRFSHQSLGNLVKKISGASPHKFRHSGATEIAGAGDVMRVASYLGHKGIGVARTYVDSSKSMQADAAATLGAWDQEGDE